jgi:hypothetical protein
MQHPIMVVWMTTPRTRKWHQLKNHVQAIYPVFVCDACKLVDDTLQISLNSFTREFRLYKFPVCYRIIIHNGGETNSDD